ncbi:MAG: hypothetical protein IPP15_22630 [Saprospiraceae bacterium]|uniref:Uncharacterized protein n=1 Tax=Candidatus Opimibacter skivensis TaxID=2982028 RepID=A0A9D7T002_9BACT|nr:hypothetical protein [Candidatus Opimibacter skivensis]
MPTNNPGQLNPLRSVTAGKYVRYLTHEDISGEPYSFPLSSLRRNRFSTNETDEAAGRDIDGSGLTRGNTSVTNYFA